MMALIKQNPLYRNSMIFFVGTIVTGLGNYFYQLLMGRMLSLQDFGTLAALVNFFALTAVPAGALSTITIRKVATLKAHGQHSELRYLLFRLMKICTLVGVGLATIFLLFTHSMKQFLHLDSAVPYLVLAVTMSFVFIGAVLRGAFPGLQRFKELSLNTILESALKLGLAALLVAFSFGLAGAVAGMAIASAFALSVLLGKFLKEFRATPSKLVSLKDLPTLCIVVGLWTLALTALQSVDTILVKRFFTAEETGLYAGMSILGKLIFFASTSVAGVLLPMSTELYEEGNHQEHRKLMTRALLILVAMGCIGLFFYWLIPAFIVQILFGSRYLPFVQYLPQFGLVAVGLSLAQLLATYFLSISRRWFLGVLLAAPAVEALLIFYFHGSVGQVLNMLIAVIGALAILLLLLFMFDPMRRHV